MEWVISHKTALEFWRKTSARDIPACKRLYACRLSDRPKDAGSLRDGNPWGLTSPLHVLVGSLDARKVNQGLVCHVDSKKLPDGSFIRLPSGIIVCSPELCFMQMAAELSLVELVMLGFELCGRYRLQAEDGSLRGFRDDLPLASAASLCSFVAEMSGSKGFKKARKAMGYIIDGAASPMETVLTILLTLPYRLGGYGFPKPVLNAPIDVQVNTGVRNGTRKARYYCDLYWSDEQVDVEYDSDAYHAGVDQIFNDAARRNALSSVGVTVVTVSRRQVASTAELRKTADVLSKLLEKRLQCPESEFAKRHAELRRQILPKISP